MAIGKQSQINFVRHVKPVKTKTARASGGTFAIVAVRSH
jgi:hypothetical protein